MRTVSPLKPERLASGLVALNPGSQTVLLWKGKICSVINYQSWPFLPFFSAAWCSFVQTLEQGVVVRVWVQGWSELSWQERKVVKAERARTGVEDGREAVRKGAQGNLRGKKHSFQGTHIWEHNNMPAIISIVWRSECSDGRDKTTSPVLTAPSIQETLRDGRCCSSATLSSGQEVTVFWSECWSLRYSLAGVSHMLPCSYWKKTTRSTWKQHLLLIRWMYVDGWMLV